MEERESKVVYNDNGIIRCIRGVLDESDPDFFIVKRRDGEFRVSRKLVLTIERWKGERNGGN